MTPSISSWMFLLSFVLGTIDVCQTLHQDHAIRFDRITKRTSSDQRMAELEALMTLVSGRFTYAHGQLDPFAFGKKKRSEDIDDSQMRGYRYDPDAEEDEGREGSEADDENLKINDNTLRRLFQILIRNSRK